MQYIIRCIVAIVVAAGISGCGDSVQPARPAKLTLFPGSQVVTMTLGDDLRLPVRLTDAAGSLLPLPSDFSLVSRNPAIVEVESTTVLHGNGLGSTWAVGTVATGSDALSDSISVTVGCTLELQASVTPTAQTLHVGESFTPVAKILSCGGRLQVSDSLRWSASDAAIVQVDSVTGRTTGLAPGQAVVSFDGRSYHVGAGVTVTVTP